MEWSCLYFIDLRALLPSIFSIRAKTFWRRPLSYLLSLQSWLLWLIREQLLDECQLIKCVVLPDHFFSLQPVFHWNEIAEILHQGHLTHCIEQDDVFLQKAACYLRTWLQASNRTDLKEGLTLQRTIKVAVEPSMGPRVSSVCPCIIQRFTFSLSRVKDT